MRAFLDDIEVEGFELLLPQRAHTPGEWWDEVHWTLQGYVDFELHGLTARDLIGKTPTHVIVTIGGHTLGAKARVRKVVSDGSVFIVGLEPLWSEE